MKKKIYARLLAIVMSAGLVLQPVAVYATEPDAGNTLDSVEAEADLLSDTSDKLPASGWNLHSNAPSMLEIGVGGPISDVIFNDDYISKLYAATFIRWLEKSGDSWDEIDSDDAVFKDTSYKYEVIVGFREFLLYKSHYLTPNFTFTVDGAQFNIKEINYYPDGEIGSITFESPEYTPNKDIEPPVIIDARLTNVYIDGDYLYWDFYNGMHSGYDIQLNGESVCVYKGAPFDLKTACDNKGIAKGIVSVRIAAVNLEEQGDMFVIVPLTEYTELKYNYGGGDSEHVWSTASATSNYESIPQLGKPIEQPTFDIEGDLPLEVIGNWFKETENDTWDETDFDQFTAGKWRYEACIQFTADDIDYKLSDDFSLQVNGKTWDKEIIKIETEEFIFSTCIFYSEVFDIEGSREIIGEINATSNLQEILVYGNKLIVPHFESGDEKVWVYNSRIERDDGEGFHWIEMGEEYTVTEGRYRAFVQVEVPKDCYDTYAISDSTKLTVNGTEWKYYETNLATDGDVINATYVSPDIVVSAGTPAVPEGGKWIQKYGASYYETPDGQKATGMQKIGTQTYLFSKNGTLQKNAFYESEGQKFYFGSDGKMCTGWFDKWGASYYADEDGVVQTGFADIGDDTYYFKDDGRMTVSTWITVGDSKYYSKANGHLAKSETILKWGKKYTFDDRGVLIN